MAILPVLSDVQQVQQIHNVSAHQTVHKVFSKTGKKQFCFVMEGACFAKPNWKVPSSHTWETGGGGGALCYGMRTIKHQENISPSYINSLCFNRQSLHGFCSVVFSRVLAGYRATMVANVQLLFKSCPVWSHTSMSWQMLSM